MCQALSRVGGQKAFDEEAVKLMGPQSTWLGFVLELPGCQETMKPKVI